MNLTFSGNIKDRKNGLNMALVKKGHKKSWDKSRRNELCVIAKLKLCADITSMV